MNQADSSKLVLQFRGGALADLDETAALEEDLIDVLGDSAEVDGHDVGSSETNIFIFSSDPADTLLFTNARGQPLTRFGVRYLLRRYVAAATPDAPTLRDKRIHPHSLRHSTAIALLKAGVDFATISQWLGHAGLNTTMRYARADIDLKRQALAQVFPDALAPPRGGRLMIDGRDLVGWLRRM